MKKFAKILSILCALALIASCVSVGFVASAAEATFSYTAYEDFNAQTSYDAYGVNHLAGATVSAKATEIIDGVPTSAGSWTPGTGLTDNSPAAQQMIQVTWPSGVANAATDSTSTNQYLDYTFALPSGVNNPEMVLLAFVQTGTNVNWSNTFFDCRHWAIYASDSAETLYSGEPIYYRQISGQAAPEYKVDISDLELKNVKYFGVRVYNFYFWGNTVLFSEIGLYGGKATFQGNPEPTSDNYATRFGDNWLTSSSYVSTESVDGVTGTPKSVIGSISVDNLWSTGRTMYQTNNGMSADNNEDGQTDTYFQTTFTLAAPVNNPETALIAWANSNGSQPDTVSQESHHYEIFASDKLDDLYTKSVYKHYTTRDVGWEHVIDISNQELKNVKYFGIRIYHRTTDLWNAIMVITEIGLYGGNSILTDSATYTDDENNAYDYGQNILFGSTVTTAGKFNGADATFSGESNLADMSTLTNNITTNRDQIQIADTWDENYSFSKANENTYIEVTFELKKAVINPAKFLIAHDQPSYESNPTVNQWYEIYASDTAADLYENSIFVYKNASAKMVEQQVDLSGMNLGTVKYFGIRFYYLYKGCFALPSEIALYGGEVVKTATHTVSYQSYSKNSSYTTYGTNHLKYSALEIISTDGTTTAIGSAPVASSDSLFTDSGTIVTGTDILTEANNGVEQTTAYLQAQFILNGAVDNPEKIVFIHHNSTNGSYNSAHYAVFASASLATLYDKALYEYKSSTGAGEGNTHTIDISELELQDIKYVAIRFYHRGYKNYAQHVEEIGLYGGNADATASKMQTFFQDGVDAPATNHLTGKAATLITVSPTGKVATRDNAAELLAGYTDRSVANADTGAQWDSNVGNGGYFQVTYELGGTLNNPDIIRLQAAQYLLSDRGYNIYLSDSLETLYDAPYISTNTEIADGYKQVMFNVADCNLTGIKYIGLRVTSYNSIVQITEFSVEGGTFTEDVNEPEVSISLNASVFNSQAGQNANDITYKVNVTSDSTIVDMGIISGFKVNIDADANFTGDYAEYLKTAPATAVKVSATAEQISNPELYFHITNSGTAGTADYSGYKLVTIAYVTVEFEGEEYTYYSEYKDLSSKQISRRQAKAYYIAGYVIEGYEDYDFETDAYIDIAKVREYVELCALKKNEQ